MYRGGSAWGNLFSMSGECPEFVCPRCRGQLFGAEAVMKCGSCLEVFPVRDGLVYFEEADEKYEMDTPNWWDKGTAWWNLPFLDAGITWFFWKHLPKSPVVLDVGCGVGLKFIASRARRVYGIDRAPTRLKIAREIYDEVSVASLLSIPYPDGSFDALISVDVIEHIPVEVKDAAIAEMRRVLRPGGRMLHIQDLLSRKPLHRWAESYPALFEKHFIEQMGHYGLEPATAAIARFDRAGLKRIAVEPTNRTILQLPENYCWQFDNEYLGKSRWVKFLTSVAWFIRRHKIVGMIYSGFYQLIWTRTFERLFPVDRSFNLAYAGERPETVSD